MVRTLLMQISVDETVTDLTAIPALPLIPLSGSPSKSTSAKHKTVQAQYEIN